MRAIEATEAVESLLSELGKGESLEIRRGNVTVAFMYPVRHPLSDTRIVHDFSSVSDAIDQMRQFQEHHSLGGLSIKSLIEEGRL